MPLIRVELFDYRITPEVSAALIEKLTDALCEAVHPGLRDHTLGDRPGTRTENWGEGGKPWPVAGMPRPEACRRACVSGRVCTRRSARAATIADQAPTRSLRRLSSWRYPTQARSTAGSRRSPARSMGGDYRALAAWSRMRLAAPRPLRARATTRRARRHWAERLRAAASSRTRRARPAARLLCRLASAVRRHGRAADHARPEARVDRGVHRGARAGLAADAACAAPSRRHRRATEASRSAARSPAPARPGGRRQRPACRRARRQRRPGLELSLVDGRRRRRRRSKTSSSPVSPG